MIVLLLSQSSRAQDLDYDCADIITFKFSSDGGIWVSDYVYLQEDNQRNEIGIVLAVPDDASVLMLSMVTRGIGCIPKGAIVEFELSDLTVITFGSDNAYNCKGHLQVFFGDGWNRGKELRKLCKVDIKSIRISGNGGVIQRDLSEEDALYLQASFVCLGNMVGLF